MSGVRCFHSERDGEMGFAGAGWAQEHDVAGLGQECAGGQRGGLLSDAELLVPVEVFEGFAGREPGATNAEFPSAASLRIKAQSSKVITPPIVECSLFTLETVQFSNVVDNRYDIR